MEKFGKAKLNFCKMFPIFLKHSYREIANNRCSFILSLFSVLMAVLIAMTSNSIIGQSSLIYLRISELNNGQYDITVSPVYEQRNTSFVKYLNFTQIAYTLGNAFPCAPRKEFNNSRLCNTLFKETPTIEELNAICSETVFTSTLLFIDTEKEKNMSLGTAYKYESMKYGECNIPLQLARKMNASEGDHISISISSIQYLNYISALNSTSDYQAAHDSIDPANKTTAYPFSYDLIRFYNSSNYVACKVSHIYDGYNGKVSADDSDNTIFMEYQYLIEYLSFYFPSTSWLDKQSLLLNSASMNPYYSADKVLINFPSPRESKYDYSDYEYIQKNTNNISGNITDMLGFYPVALELPLVSILQELSMGGEFLGIMLDLIVIILCVISAMLIYTLLMVSIESKSFDLGVMRLNGLTKSGVVMLILMQAFLFVIPAFILGFILITPLLSILSHAIKSFIGVGFKPIPSGYGILKALVIGLLVPLISSIVPVHSIITQKLSEALDTTRSKIQGAKVTVEFLQKQINWPYIIIGFISLLFGVAIYYLFPLSIFTLNFELLLWLMLSILLAIIIALIILSMNFIHLLQTGLIYLILFFERTSMKMLIHKCLIAHKFRNRRTTIAFALSLSFIIFSIVSYHLQLTNTLMLDLLRYGAPVVVSGIMKPWDIEKYLNTYDEIEQYSWAMPRFSDYSQQGIIATEITDYSRSIKYTQSIVSISPNYFNTIDTTYLKVDKQNTQNGIGLAENLYTPQGTQSVGLSTFVANTLNMNMSYNSSAVLLFSKSTSKIVYQTRAAFILSSCPGFKMSWRIAYASSFDLMSIPMYMKLLRIPSVESLISTKLLITPKQNADVPKLVSKLNSLPTYQNYTYKVWSYNKQEKLLEDPKKYLDLVFGVIIVIFMFLCYFSLSSSMTTNIFEQSKEIAIMRAEGMRRGRVIALFVYEALILVLASSLIGVVIGNLIAFSFSAQQAVWNDIPIEGTIEYIYVVVIFCVAIVCAFLSAFFPARYMLSKPISQLALC